MTPRALSLAALLALTGCSSPEKPPPPEAPPAITSFSVDKARIAPGEAVTFTLTTQRAKSVELIDQDGVATSVSFDASQGSGTATATPGASAFFILHADGDGGRDTAFVQVAVDEGLQSVFLVVAPPVIHAGESVDVVWSAADGKNASLTAGTRSLSTDSSGSLTDTPALSTTYTLRSEKADGTALTTSVTVQVIPVVESFTLTPPAATQGADLELQWRTAGGERVVVSEATFGPLVDTTTGVAQGSHTFTVPSALPDGGVAVRDGFPLRFTLTLSATSPAQAVSRALDSRVGAGPQIDAFDVASAGTRGAPLTISWATTNAWRVELYADGLLLHAPLAGTRLDASFDVPPLTAPTDFTLVAYDFNGLSTRVTKHTAVVDRPTVTSFTVTSSVAQAGMPITATWQTANATRVVIRAKGGANLFVTDAATQVASGNQAMFVGATTTFVLEAANAAGDTVTAEARTVVGTPRTIAFSPQPAPAGATITASWDLTSLTPNDLPGLPDPTPESSTSTGPFIDLETIPEATTLYFANPDRSVAAFSAPQGFVFPFVTSRVTTLTASVNGVLVLGPSSVGDTNADVASPNYPGPALLAPFWDDLDLGANGSVKYFLEGATFPRKLLVQWSRLQKAGTSSTELTFQVQLFETGEFRFVYRTLLGADTSSATVGAVESPGSFAASVGYNVTGTVGAGEELRWFANDIARATGTQDLRLRGHRPFGFFVELPSGQLMNVSGTARTFSTDMVVVSEALPLPSQLVSQGHWIELKNNTDEALDLTGLELASGSGGAATSFFFQDLTLDGGAHLVLGESTNPADNGEANVQVAWAQGQLPLQPADSVELRIPDATPFVISSLTWTGGTADGGVNSSPGQSVQPAERAIRNGQDPWPCTRTQTFGAALQVGTPGAINETCYFYRLQPIPASYVDISSFGAPVFAPGTSMSGVVTANGYELPAPLTYFGTVYSTVWISSNGWISVRPQPTSGSGNPWLTDTTRSPQGVIAPFWDSLRARGNEPEANVYVARVGSATIVQWHRMSETIAGQDDDMNFQAKLFDDGVIEIHYGNMISANAAQPFATGYGATVWLERPWYSDALPILRNATQNLNNPTVAPHSAYRFTPVP
ncbi:MAG: lamin tail domain-containing protein [Myxococcales bacterium]|nr:lamin tail domain-containing protein [Myxococcales bacterium]